MQTVAEATAGLERDLEAGEARGDLGRLDVDGDEVLEARRVDEGSAARERVEGRGRRRVAAVTAAAIQLRDGECQVRNQRVQERALADPRRSDQRADPVGREQPLDRVEADPLRRRNREDFAGAAVDLDESLRERRRSRQIELVHDDRGLDSRRARDHDAAIDVARLLARLGGDYDKEPIEVDGDRPLATPRIPTPKNTVGGQCLETIARDQHPVADHRPLIGGEPDLPRAAFVEADHYGDTVVRHDAARLLFDDLSRSRPARDGARGTCALAA